MEELGWKFEVDSIFCPCTPSGIVFKYVVYALAIPISFLNKYSVVIAPVYYNKKMKH